MSINSPSLKKNLANGFAGVALLSSAAYVILPANTWQDIQLRETDATAILDEAIGGVGQNPIYFRTHGLENFVEENTAHLPNGWSDGGTRDYCNLVVNTSSNGTSSDRVNLSNFEELESRMNRLRNRINRQTALIEDYEQLSTIMLDSDLDNRIRINAARSASNILRDIARAEYGIQLDWERETSTDYRSQYYASMSGDGLHAPSYDDRFRPSRSEISSDDLDLEMQSFIRDGERFIESETSLPTHMSRLAAMEESYQGALPAITELRAEQETRIALRPGLIEACVIAHFHDAAVTIAENIAAENAAHNDNVTQSPLRKILDGLRYALRFTQS